MTVRMFPETNQREENMTIANMTDPQPVPTVNRGGRPKGSTDKVLKDIVQREDRKLARIKMEQSLTEARTAAEDIARVVAIRAEQKARVHEQYSKQEAVRAPQFQIDTRPVLKLLLVLSIVTFLTTAILTADGTVGSAGAARFFSPVLGFVLFGAFEIAILAFMLMYYVLGSRIDYEGQPVKATRWFVAMIATAALTVGLSIYHVLDLYAYDWTSIDMWVGIFIRLAVAVFFVLVSKGVASVLFAKAIQL